MYDEQMKDDYVSAWDELLKRKEAEIAIITKHRNRLIKLVDIQTAEIARLKEEATKREKRLEQIVQEQRDTIILFEKSHAALREKVERLQAEIRELRGFVETDGR